MNARLDWSKCSRGRKCLLGMSVAALLGSAQAMTLTVNEDRALTDAEKATLNGGTETELIKQGTGVLTTDGLTGFKGTITVKSGGAIRITAANGLGKSGTVVNVESGASLLVCNATRNAVSLSGIEVKVAGSGYDGAGAVQVSEKDQNYLFYKLTLTDDAKLGGTQSWGSINTGTGSVIDFGGHTLTNAYSCMWRFGQMLNPGNIVQTGGSIQATGGCGFIGGDGRAFVLDGGTLSLYDWRIPCTWTLHVKRTTNVHPGSGTSKALSNVWSGPTIIDDGVTFGVGSTAAQTKDFQMTLGGKVTGGGKLVAYNLATINLLSENDFTGGVAMGNGGSIVAAVDGALPVINGNVTLPTLTTSCRVYLTARSESAPNGWTLEHINQYLASDICYYCVVETPSDETFDLGKPATRYNGLLSTGAGFSITGSVDATTPVVLATSNLSRGTLTLGGGFFSFHDADGKGGTVSVRSDYGVAPLARLVVASDYRGLLQGGVTTPRMIDVGCTPGKVGVVDIADGAVVSNGFNCGGVVANEASQMKSGQIAAGAVYQRGGVVAACDKTSVYLADNGGYGYYELRKGKLYANYPCHAGGRNGIGIFRQDGGTWTMGANSVTVGNGGTGVVYQTAGTLTTTTADISLGNTGGTGWQATYHPFANWTIAGTAQTETRNFFGGAHSNFKSYLNLIDGGTLYANNIHKRETGYLPSGSSATELVNNDFYVNFNGGVFRRRLQDNLFNPSHLPTRVTVYPKGAIFRVDGTTTLGYVDAPLLAPGAGNGVTSVACPDRTDYIGAPFVEIVGNGQGATAAALFDVDQGSVTNVVITSPGWGYTEATAVFTGGGRKGSVSTVCTLGSVAGGGIVKRGTGKLELRAVNTYTGPTTVEAGTLKQYVAGAIPSGTKLVMTTGATLDLNSFATTFSGVEGSGGKVTNGDLVLTGAITLSAQKFIDRETTTVDGVLDLTGVTQLTLTDTEVLTEEARSMKSLTLLTATTIRYSATPFEIVGVPSRWRVTCSPKGVRLGPDRGLYILLK